MCLRGKNGPDARNFNQLVSLGRINPLIRTFPSNFASLKTSNNQGVVMKTKILSLALVAVIAGCGKAPEEPAKPQEQTSPIPAAPTMSYEQLIITDNAVGDVFIVSALTTGNAINYQSRAGVTNVLESIVQYPDATGYVKIEKAYKFGEKYVLIVSTGENGNSCPATTYAFAFDTKSESVAGKKQIDGCSENVESLSDGNKLIVKKEGVASTFFNGEIK